MATLGNSPGFTGYEYASVNTENQIGTGLYTMPVNGTITDLTAIGLDGLRFPID